MRNHEKQGRRPDGHVIPDGESACLWMQAGYIAHWLCDLEFRCDRCPLDAALRHLHGELPKSEFAPGRYGVEPQTATASPQPAAPTAAPFEAAPSPAPGTEPSAKETPSSDVAASGRDAAADPADLLDLPLGALDPRLLYHPGHTWVRVEAPGRVQVGLDAFAVRIAGRARSVIVPHAGTRLRRGRPCAWIDLVGGTLTVLAPLSGTVVETNEALRTNPELLDMDPLGAGWLLVLEPTDPKRELRRLEPADRFAHRLERDADTWRRRVHRELRLVLPPVGATLQDGGVRVENLDQLLGARRRYEIAVFFLGAGRCLR